MDFFQKLARMITKQYSLNVYFRGDRACTDGNDIFLPYYKVLTPELKQDLIAFTHHECGHCLFTDFNPVKANKSTAVHYVSNVMEDVRIEELMSQKFPGAAVTLRNYNEKTYQAYAAKNWSEVPVLEKLFSAIFFLASGFNKIEFFELSDVWVKFAKKVAIKVRQLDSTEEVMKYAKELVDQLNVPEKTQSHQELKDLFAQRLKEMLAQEKKDKEEGKPTSGRAMTSEELQALQEALSELTEEEMTKLQDMAQESLDDSGASAFNPANNPTMDAQGEAKFKAHREKEAKEEINSGSKLTNSFSSNAFSIPLTTHLDKEIDYTKTPTSREFMSLMSELKPFINPIREKIERTLITPNRPNWKTNQHRGRINTRAIGQAIIPPTAFKAMFRTNPESAAVSILVDLSGSMHGEKVVMAKKTALALAAVLDLLKVPFEVLGFNDHSSNEMSRYSAAQGKNTRYNRTTTVLHKQIFKSFGTNNLFGITKMQAGGANPDGEAVSWAAGRLQDRNEKRKILFVLSDGQPASCGDNSILCSDLKRRIKELSRSNLEILGLGIMSDSVAEFYPNHVVINKLEELPAQAVSQMVKLLSK